MPIDLLCVSFGKCVLRTATHSSVRLFLFCLALLLSCRSCLYTLKIKPLPVTLFANIFSYSIYCLFILFMVSIAVQKLISLIRSHLFIFAFTCIALGDWPQKMLVWFMSENCVFCHVLYFSFLSHFGLIFLYGVRMCSSFIDFHAEVQPSQHHLLKRLSFPNCIHSLLIYQRLIVHRCVSLFLSFLFCPLIHMPVFMPILCCFDSCSFIVLSGV